MTSLKKSALGSAALLSAAWMAATPVQAADETPTEFSPAQIENIEEIVHDFILANPEVLIEALQTYQENQRLAEERHREEAVVAFQAQLDNGYPAPVLGNPDGDVTLVEFFDYRCGYCKMVAPRVQQALDEDPNLRVVMMEFPILSPQSVEGAKAALAAEKQGKYEEFHFALMARPGNMSQAHILATAESVGLDPDQLAEDMESDEIAGIIEQNREIGQALGVSGTPAMIVGDQFIPGAVDLSELKNRIAQAREQAS